MSHFENPLTGKRGQIAADLAAGLNVRAAAAAAGVSARTVHRYRADPKFTAEVRALRKQMAEEAVGRLTVLREKAITALGQLLDSENQRIVLGAVTATFGAQQATVEQHDIVARLAALERVMGDADGE